VHTNGKLIYHLWLANIMDTYGEKAYAIQDELAELATVVSYAFFLGHVVGFDEEGQEFQDSLSRMRYIFNTDFG